MGEIKTYYRRNLPHYQPPEATFFVTFRLAGSLPKEIIMQLLEERICEDKLLQKVNDPGEREQMRLQLEKRHFVKYDRLLETASNGPYWLRIDRVAEIVTEAIHFRDGREYELLAYCIMPNHVHIVFTLLPAALPGSSGYFVTDILGSLKKHTALEANRALQRIGQFWHHESYDHVVRNEQELSNIISYVLNNPVKAGFVSEWEEWKWSYCKPEL